MGTNNNNDNLLDLVLEPRNLNDAYLQVYRNKGSHGVDGMDVNSLKEYLKTHGSDLKEQLLYGKSLVSH